MKKDELFGMVKTAVDNNSDVVLTFKKECNGKFPIPVTINNKIAMEVLEFLNEKYGEKITVGDQIEILQTAIWWTTAMGIL